MLQELNRRKSIIIHVMLSAVFFYACEDFQVKSYNISSQDARACGMLQDTLLIPLTTVPVNHYDSGWSNDRITQIAGEFITALINDTNTVYPCDSVFVMAVEDRDTSYFALTGSLSRNLMLYFDDVLEMELYSGSGSLLTPADNIMPLETVGECTYVDENKKKPLIRTRLEYGTPDQEYLVRIIKIDQTEKLFIRLAIIPGE